MAIELPKRGREGELKSYQGRYAWLLFGCVFAFLILGFRFWQIQIIDGEEYYLASTQNIIRQVEVPAPRGEIFDRYGVALAQNRPSFDVVVVPSIFARHADEEVYELLREYLHLSASEEQRLRRQVEARVGEVMVRRDVSRGDLARLEEDRMRLPGVEVRVRAQRHYPLHHVGAHALGYVAEVSPSELPGLRRYGVRQGDLVGRMGLERSFEEILHGSPGTDRRVVDARGNPVGEAQTRFLIGDHQRVEPVAGRNLVTTLDADLMVIIDDAMGDRVAGAVVAIDPRDGSVRALYSKPHFNPNAWSGRLSAMEKMRVDNDPFRPLVDKTLNGYFPGSVFKIVGTLAALGDGHFHADDTVTCRGSYRFGDRRYRCWRDAGHGPLNVVGAMAQSCDVYYYRLADEMGLDRLAEYGRMFGFGERTGIPLPRESAGRMPDREWYRQFGADGYNRGADLNTVIGQGDTLTTPLQVAMAYGAIANGGDLFYPRLVEEVQNQAGETLFEYRPRVRKRVEMDPEHLEVLRESLREVLRHPRGTAHRHRLDHTELGGKTGTAQVARIGAVRVASEDRELRQRHHGWFAAYGPYEDPELVLVVFLEHGGGGGDAADVAREILDRYFTRDSPRALRTRVADAPEYMTIDEAMDGEEGQEEGDDE